MSKPKRFIVTLMTGQFSITAKSFTVTDKGKLVFYGGFLGLREVAAFNRKSWCAVADQDQLLVLFVQNFGS